MVAGEIGEVARRWRSAYEAWQSAVVRRDQAVALASRRVDEATGGLGVRRVEALCRRRRIHTRAEALMVAKAVRARPVVRSALEDLERVRKDEEADVLARRTALAEASRYLLRCGELGRQVAGIDLAELRRLSRRPGSDPGSRPG